MFQTKVVWFYKRNNRRRPTQNVKIFALLNETALIFSAI